MNRTYKTVWNAKKGQLVVANETQKAKGKTGKTLTVLAVAAAVLIGTVAQAAYVEQGKIGDVSSWETDEYQKDWGLAAMNASTAYSLGFHGQGVTVGVMDSGALLQVHPDLAGDRFHATHITGQYTTSGQRYHNGQLAAGTDRGEYKEGETYDITGDWKKGVNDSHGTHVTGTVGGNRDGSEFHGVSWGSDIYVGNTGGTDNTNYGPYQDPGYFLNAWGTLADAVNAGNNGRGGVINNSFGTNIRISMTDVPTTDEEAEALNAKLTDGRHWAKNARGVWTLYGKDGGSVGTMFPTNTVEQTEYEYFLFNNKYGTASDGTLNKNFVDSAWEAVKDKKVVQVFTTGNRDMDNPFYRPLYPYFNPEAEKQWIAVAGLAQGTDGNYKLEAGWNEAGNAKWWTVTAPGRNIYSSKVDADGNPFCGKSSGTSMAAPHVSGAFGVLMSRYGEMDALQVREVLLTTASHDKVEGWDVADGEVSERFGWGVPDLDKGMYGLGQMLGEFNYNMSAGSLDVWSNDISEVALNQREKEDKDWLKKVTGSDTDYMTAEVKAENGGDYILGEDNGFKIEDLEDYAKIDAADAKKWRQAYYDKRAQAIREKLKNGLYDGSLVKSGEGTLVLTGENTYEGKTTVLGGTLQGFTESFGKHGGNVQVNGGKFGLLTSYYDELTQKGTLTSNEASQANVTVNNGGTLLITAGHDAVAGNIVFKEGAKISMTSDDLKSVYQGEDATTTITAASIEGLDLAKADDTLAFFKTSFEAGTPETRAPGSTITATLTRNEDVSMSSIATTANGRAIGAALEAAGEGELFDAVLGGTTDQVAATYDSLGSDAFLNAQNASIVNTLTMTRAIQDQATGIGHGRAIDFADGTGRLWATGVGSWGSVDYGQASIDNDFYAGFIGGEVKVADSSKVGVFFGAGTSEFKGGSHGKIKSNDVHFGIYGVSNIADLVAANYGITYTKQDRDMSRTLAFGSQTGANATSGNADILQLFAEGAYTGFNTAQYSVEPYVGFNWLNVKADDFAETVGNTTFTTNNKTQNLQVTTLGVRGAVPFTVGNVAMTVKGNAGWSHFFGDTEAKATMGLGGSGFATIKGGELKDQANIGLGIEAQLTKSATFGFSYTGTYDGDVTASGVSANLRIAF